MAQGSKQQLSQTRTKGRSAAAVPLRRLGPADTVASFAAGLSANGSMTRTTRLISSLPPGESGVGRLFIGSIEPTVLRQQTFLPEARQAKPS
jgi:hypothetical protein